MRSIILTDKQHASLKVFIDHALIKDQYYMNEKLYREIMDVKCCENCRWGNMDDLLCEDTGVPIPCKPGFEEGPDIYYSLFCWKRK